MKHEQMNEDQRQEYACLVLEGVSPEEAQVKCWVGDALDRNHPARGPRQVDSRGWSSGNRPLVLDMSGEGEAVDSESGESTSGRLRATEGALRSMTQDHRTEQEREHDWAMTEWANETLDRMTDKQRQAFEYKYGLNGRPKLSVKEIGALLGVSPRSIEDRLRWGKHRVLGTKRQK